MPGPQSKGVCFACGFEHWEDSCPVCERTQSLREENTRLRAVIENLPVCAYGPCLNKGIWDFSDTEHGLRVYCQQHAEDRARDIGDFVEHCAELVSYADALGALETK